MMIVVSDRVWKSNCTFDSCLQGEWEGGRGQQRGEEILAR